MKEAESSSNGGNISKERLLKILVEYRKFTQEEAEYAIEHAKNRLVELNNSSSVDLKTLKVSTASKIARTEMEIFEEKMNKHKIK